MAVDKSGSAEDRALDQLRKLREGSGLTAARLASCGDLLSVLATSDPAAGVDALREKLDQLPDDDKRRALSVDLGLDLPVLLGREPVPREVRYLGERRNAYAAVVSRDVKTLARWSDVAALELRRTLLTDRVTGCVTVIAAVDGGRVAGITLRRPGGATSEAEELADSFENHCPDPSLPCLIYAFPRDWKPSELRLAVAFRHTPYPSTVWAVVAPTFFELVFAEERYPLPLQEGMVMARIERPRRDRLYGIFWAS